MSGSDESSLGIAKKSKSNLAFALALLPRERRDAMISFYAYCRQVDDIADDHGATVAARRQGLDAWREGIEKGFSDPTSVQLELEAIRERYAIPNEWLIDLIDGMEMDLTKKRYATIEELREYCYRVASVVGRVSIKIFGCEDPGSDAYGTNLGYALQLTNILRDVGEDLREDGRIYLPGEELDRFGVTEDGLREERCDAAFCALMEFQYQRARGYYRDTVESLPRVDRGRVQAFEAMRMIYGGILEAMRADGFRVFERRYRIGKPRMLGVLALCWARRLLA